MPARAPDAPPVRRCSTRAPPPCLCARSAACRECPRRGDQNACSRARCRFVHPFPLSYAGSRSHSDSDMRVRAADPHSHMQARSSCVLYSRFPGSPASDSRFPGRNGRHRAGIRRETWNPQRKSPGPRRGDQNACLCARSAACRECPHRAAQNACSRARCRFVHPFPLSYAGSRSHSDSDMRVRAADPHSHMQARSSCVLYSRFPRNCEAQFQVSRQPPLSIPGFPAEMTVIGQEYDGKPGIHTGSAQAPRTQKGSTTCED